MWKLWIWVFLNIMLCYYFSLEAVLQDMAKNNPTKKINQCRNCDIEACASVKSHRRENVIVTNCKDRFKL